MDLQITASEIVFGLTLLVTFAVALIARRHSKARPQDGLSGEKLNRWLIGLSAGVVANSGFVVTAAVGLGYSYGVQWVMLPLAWLLGDIVFWTFFPSRINALGSEAKATTLSDLLAHKLNSGGTVALSVLCALIVVVCLAGYVGAQWVAGSKFLEGAYGIGGVGALALFAVVIISYTGIGGFRGSVYADLFQAIVRIIGTVIAMVGIGWFALNDQATFNQNIAAAGPDFLSPFPGGTIVSIAGFVLGFAAASLGFGLGQPQIVSRYMAGSTPEETKAAFPIYIFFVQATWISMTVFGVLLRGVMPNIADPETGLSTFFANNFHAALTGVIVADIFATIAGTANGILVAMSQAVTRDLLPRLFGPGARNMPLWPATLVLGALTMAFALNVQSTVMTLALSSASLMGAGLAAPVMVKVLRWPHSSVSLLIAMIAGLGAALAWKSAGLGGQFNEAGIGIAAGLLTNMIVAAMTPHAKAQAQGQSV